MFSDELANTNAFISSQIDEAGQQIIVVTANDDGKQIETTADALIDEAEPSTTGGLEPPAKKIRIQHQDGQTFILAVSGIHSCIYTKPISIMINFNNCREGPQPVTTIFYLFFIEPTCAYARWALKAMDDGRLKN